VPNREAQLVEPPKDFCQRLGDGLVDDELTSVRATVEADVQNPEKPQPRDRNGATRVPETAVQLRLHRRRQRSDRHVEWRGGRRRGERRKHEHQECQSKHPRHPPYSGDCGGTHGRRIGLVRVLVLQHIACEPPGVYEDVLRERGAKIHRVELEEGEPLPDRREVDAIVCMGGPMSAMDDAELPWLAAEKAFTADSVHAGVPFWGVCLGVQLLAASLGARVYPGPAPEVGVLPVELTAEGLADPVFAGLPPVLPTLQWHGDTFDLPEGAVRLAGSPAYPNQAFRFGPTAYGVQFHVEVSPELAREWAAVPEYAEALERVLGPGALDDLIGRLEADAAEMLAHGSRLFERWLDQALVVTPS